MTTIIKKEIQLSKKQQGATMVEYAIMVALIAIVAIAAVATLGKTVNSTFTGVNSVMSAG